jgi:hypothetical protein
MRHVTSKLGRLFVVAVAVACAQSQPSTKTVKQPNSDQRGTEQSPVIVKVLPSTKTKEEADTEKAKDLDQSSANWWMVRLTAAIVFVGAIQTVVFGLQARRLKQTIDTMEEISSKQTADIQASLTQTTNAASSMQNIAISMATSVQSVKESVAINREIADRQKLITELQSRAYLTMVFDGVVPQGPSAIFESVIRILNQGNTPAYNIEFAMVADVLPFPLNDDFAFPLPPQRRFSSPIGPAQHKIISAMVAKRYSELEVEQIVKGIDQRLVAWGIVSYEDAFKIKRFVKFGYAYHRTGENQWLSTDTIRHNESD